jgi:hypothetical protein
VVIASGGPSPATPLPGTPGSITGALLANRAACQRTPASCPSHPISHPITSSERLPTRRHAPDEPPCSAAWFGTIGDRLDVTKRSAKPCTPVRFRSPRLRVTPSSGPKVTMLSGPRTATVSGERCWSTPTAEVARDPSIGRTRARSPISCRRVGSARLGGACSRRGHTSGRSSREARRSRWSRPAPRCSSGACSRGSRG